MEHPKIFLSRVLVDKRSKLPADGYAWHRLLWEAFRADGVRARDFLFRVDDLGRMMRVYLLSSRPPRIPSWGVWEWKEIPARFLQYDRYRFQLKANPTMRRRRDGRRLGLFREDLLREWIRRKAAAGGFAIMEEYLIIGAPIEARFYRGGRAGKHIAVEFRGILTVKDRSRFAETFRRGIGSAKAFGYGLLMLEPLAAATSMTETVL